MRDLIKHQTKLPLNNKDQFDLVGQEKLNALRAEKTEIEEVELAKAAYEKKLKEAQVINEAVLEAEIQIARLLEKVPKDPDGRPYRKKTTSDTAVQSRMQTKSEVIKQAGLTPKQVRRFEALAKHPDVLAKAKEEAREKDEVVTRAAVLKKAQAQKKKEEIRQAEKSIHDQASDEFKPHLRIGNGIGFTPAEKYDLLLTDPPYSTDIKNIEEFVDSWLYAALDGVKDTGFAYVFVGAYPDELKAYLNAKLPPHMNLCQVLIWAYKNTVGNNPKDRYKQNYQVCLFYRGVNAPNLDCPLTNEQWAVQEINAPDGRQGDRYHAWQKPMEIGERFVRHSTKQGMTVFDPFACTGTFLLAATKLGRKAFGFEINPENARIAIERGCVLDG